MAILQKKTYLLISILVLSILFRFWELPQRFIFDIDTQYQALFARTIIRDFHIIWIGVSASNTGYYLGPGLVYLTSFLLLLSKGDPIALGYFASLVGVATTFSLAYIAYKLYGEKVSLISTFLYSASFFISSYDRRYWPIFVSLIAVWIFFALKKAEKEPRWLIVATALISIAYHVHLSLLLLWPFIVWRFFRSFKKTDIVTWIGSIISYFLITLPLLAFDIMHNFDNLLAPLRFFKNKGVATSGGFPENGELLFALTNAIWYPHILVSLFTIVIFAFLVKNRKEWPLLAGIILLFTVAFSLYTGPIQQYYIVFLFPFMTIAAGLLLARLPTQITIPLLLVFLGLNLLTLLTIKVPSGLATKKQLIESVSKKIQEPYFLDFEGDRDMEGWQYLFVAYGKKPAQSKTDNMFGWLYRHEIAEKKPELRLFMSTDPRLIELSRDVPPGLNPKK